MGATKRFTVENSELSCVILIDWDVDLDIKLIGQDTKEDEGSPVRSCMWLRQ